MSGDRTLSLEVETQSGETVTRHYNADNVTFFTRKKPELTDLAFSITLGLSIVLTVSLFLVVEWWQALIVGFVTWVILLYLLARDEGITIGTLTETHYLGVNEADEVEEEFKRAARNLLSVSNTHETAYYDFIYTHHFVPDNIVSIERSRGETIDLPAIIALGGIFFGMIGGWLTVDIKVGGIILVGFWVVAWFAEPIEGPDTLRIELQDGDSHVFKMTSNDATDLIGQFQASR